MKTCSGVAFVVLLAGAVSLSAATENGKLGDGNDGNRSTPTHIIPLLDEQGLPIRPDDERPRPISMRNTCGECHDYERIAKGWHFHSGILPEDFDSGRIGEPWVLTDPVTRTQIPVSNRNWPGAFSPYELGMTPWQFLENFGTHFPGGNYGEMIPADDDMTADPYEILRWPISGPMEINCLACHNRSGRQDMGGPTGAAMMAARENYRWVATAGSGVAMVKGTASALDNFYDPQMEYKIETVYDAGRFDADNRVFLDIVRQPPADRCYFCHSTRPIVKTLEEVGVVKAQPEAAEPEATDGQTGGEAGAAEPAEPEVVTETHVVDLTAEVQWMHDEDIHLTAGMTCADCHRNGDGHQITRGITERAEGDKGARSTLSCRGCHLGDATADSEAANRSGRLGAPHPTHPGIPAIHFRKLTCTACHSGPFPGAEAGAVQTSRVHRIGLHGAHATVYGRTLPHLLSPVFMQVPGGDFQGDADEHRIAPHKLFYPSFWGTLAEGQVQPMLPAQIAKIAGDELGVGQDVSMDQLVNNYRPLSEETIISVLQRVAEQIPEPEAAGSAEGEEAAPAPAKPEAVYIAGGKVYRLAAAGSAEDEEAAEGQVELLVEEHPTAAPYAWPVAHNVRPASQSLGVDGRCGDCHSVNAPFFFGTFTVDSAVEPEGTQAEMINLQGINRTYMKAFNFSFVFRPWMKVTVLLCCALIAFVLLAYAVRALWTVAWATSQDH